MDMDEFYLKEWGDWKDWTIEYIKQANLPDNYSLGYHQGCPTIYWGNTFACIWRVPNDTRYIDEAIRQMKQDLLH